MIDRVLNHATRTPSDASFEHDETPTLRAPVPENCVHGRASPLMAGGRVTNSPNRSRLRRSHLRAFADPVMIVNIRVFLPGQWLHVPVSMPHPNS